MKTMLGLVVWPEAWRGGVTARRRTSPTRKRKLLQRMGFSEAVELSRGLRAPAVAERHSSTHAETPAPPSRQRALCPAFSGWPTAQRGNDRCDDCAPGRRGTLSLLPRP